MKPIKVAICDDEPIFVKKLEQLLGAFCKEYGLEFQVTRFYSGEELLAWSGTFDLIFLDINMKGVSGIAAAAWLRKRNPKFILVFVSSFMEYAPRGYEVDALRYLLKSDLEHSFALCMRAVVRQMGLRRNKVAFTFVDGEREFYTDQIVYIESRRHVALFFIYPLGGEPCRLYKKLDWLEQQLPQQEFLRIHKSYLANYRYIENVLNYTAELYDGSHLPVSQSRFTEVKRAFFKVRGEIEWV